MDTKIFMLIQHEILSVISVLIYYDATRHKIGRIKGEKSFLNMPAGGWAICAAYIYLTIITIPAYLICRPKLLTKAKTHPVEVGSVHKKVVFIVLVSIGLLWVADALTS